MTHTHDSSDNPMRRVEDDRLGTAVLARMIATSITEMAGTDGLVMSIDGEWGSGKSSVLNFVEEFLAASPEPRPIVAKFNPWWFKGEQQVLQQFFDVLTTALDDNRLGTKVKTAAAALKKVQKVLARGRLLVPASIAELLREVDQSIQVVTDVLDSAADSIKSVLDSKDALEDALRGQGRRVVVFVDDLDRCLPNEVMSLMSVIRAVASLPQVVYVLAFDHQRVAEIVGLGKPERGHEFLRKIIQVPFTMPHPTQVRLARFFGHCLESSEAVVRVPDAEWDTARWSDLILRRLVHVLRTPRDCIRLATVVRATLPTVLGEVDPVDWIALEALRLGYAKTHAALPHHRRRLCGGGFGFDVDMSRGATDREWNENALEIGERQLLDFLFPFRIGDDPIPSASKFRPQPGWNRRIANPKRFAVFFRLLPESDATSHVAIREALRPDIKPDVLALKLAQLSPQTSAMGTSALQDFLEEARFLIDHGDIVVEPLSYAEALVLAGQYDLSPETRTRSSLGLGDVDGQALAREFRVTARGTEVSAIAELLSKGISVGALDVVASIILYGVAPDDRTGQPVLFAADHLRETGQALARRVASLLSTVAPSAWPHALVLLYACEATSHGEIVRAALDRQWTAREFFSAAWSLRSGTSEGWRVPREAMSTWLSVVHFDGVFDLADAADEYINDWDEAARGGVAAVKLTARWPG